MKVDYLVVGAGLAGIAFCETLNHAQKSFVVFDDDSQQSSLVAAGLYNPVMLKRFTKVWKAREQLDLALPMYAEIEKKLNIKLDYKLPIYRIFASIEEQNNWFQACDDPVLSAFMSPEIIRKPLKNINSEFGIGEVKQAGRIDTGLLSRSYKSHLKESHKLFKEAFDYKQLSFHDQGVRYKTIMAKHLIFAEGFGLQRNPYFNNLPLNGTKGELLIIHAAELKMDFVIKAAVFIIPLGKDRYCVGSTFNHADKTNLPTKKGQEELKKKLDKIISCDYKVEGHHAGIRPTVKDRRPLAGPHKTRPHLYVLNGLGTRGVMIAPYIAEELYRYIEHGKSLPPEIDIRRFD